MKVICRKIFSPNTSKDLGDSSPWFKVGNEYLILSICFIEKYGIEIYVQSEHHHEPCFVNITGFEFIDQKIPSSWICVFSKNYERNAMTLIPKSWNYPTFFEDIEDENPEAVALFNKEAIIMDKEVN